MPMPIRAHMLWVKEVHVMYSGWHPLRVGVDGETGILTATKKCT